MRKTQLLAGANNWSYRIILKYVITLFSVNRVAKEKLIYAIYHIDLAWLKKQFNKKGVFEWEK